MGSYARGDARRYCDIDIVCFQDRVLQEPSALIEIIDGKYLVRSFFSTEEVQDWFVQPEKAVQYICGLRFGQLIVTLA